MNTLDEDEDAVGRELLDSLSGLDAWEVYERDDGLVSIGTGPPAYFAEFDQWGKHEQEAIGHVQGRTLDVGCGAGRVALYLQQHGHDVVAIDVSPLAVEVCRRRGVRDARLLSLSDVDDELGWVDSVVMFGNNLGLLESERRGKRLLRRLHGITSRGGIIIAGTRDPYQATEPFHLAYHVRNRASGKLTGQTRLRVRYLNYATPWSDYLFVSREELEAIAEDTGWVVAQVIETGRPEYVAILEKLHS